MLSRTEGSYISSIPKFKSFILRPFAHGIFGFAVFLFVILIMKIMKSAIDSAQKIVFENEDVILAMIGFVLLFLIAFLKNFQQENPRPRG